MKWIRVGLILGALGLGSQTLLHVSIARAADERVTRANVSANDWGGGCWYVVRRGDNLFRIAIRHGVSYWYLAQINGLYNPNYIWAGQTLNVPCGAVPPPALPPPPPTACNPSTTYLVKPGDNLFRIAYNHGVTINALRDANNLWGRVLRPNTTLIIPCPGSVQYGNQAPAPPAPPAPPADISAGQDLSYNSRMQPKYPPQAIRQRHEGTVTLLILVGVDGSPKDIKVDKSSGYHELDRAAIEAAQHWRFNPEIKNGKKVEGYARVPVTFNLNNL